MNARKLGLIALLVVILGAMAFPTLAADKTKTVTVTLTETDINNSYRVTNPARRSITNVHVDLQPGQVYITATFTAPKTSPIPVSATLVPSVSNGRVYWTVSAATANGKPAPADLLAQINASITSSWRNYWKNKYPGYVTSLTITDDTISWTKVYGSV
jgi:hypothetical protein